MKNKLLKQIPIKIFQQEELRIILEVEPSLGSYSDSSETCLAHNFKVYDLELTYNEQREIPNEDDLMMWGNIKWDGCCNFFFKDHVHHTCRSLESYAKRLQWISDNLCKYILNL